MSRILFIGEGATAETALASLCAAAHSVCAVFRTVPDPTDPVARLAAAQGIPLFGDTAIPQVRAAVTELRPDCAVISSYGRLIREDLLGMCPFVNVHYGPLPEYRGRANVNWAILNQELEAAITIHRVDAGLDSGNILFQQTIPIGPDATVTELYERLNAVQREELGAAVTRFLAGDGGVPQRAGGSYGCTRTPEDGEIDWTASTRRIYALVRALTPPFPGAYTFHRQRKFTVLCARPVPDAPVYAGRVPGRVCAVDRAAGSVDVLTGDGVFRIHEVEDGEGTRMPAAHAIRSTKDTLGLSPRDLWRQIQELRQTVERLSRQAGAQLGGEA